MPKSRPIKRTVSRLSMPARRALGVRLPPREFLLKALPKHSIGAEIGVWRGEFAVDIVRRVKPARLHLIDPWMFMEDRAGSVYGGSVAKRQADMDVIYDDVAAQFSREVRAGTVLLHRSMSADAALEFDDEYFDWVYIDGDHSYEGVLADLRAYTPKVKRGGLVTGDDYGRKGWWGPGVKKAVDQHLAEGACDLEWIKGKQFALRRPAP